MRSLENPAERVPKGQGVSTIRFGLHAYTEALALKRKRAQPT